MNKSNKIILSIVIALLVYFIVFFIFFGGAKKFSQERNEATIILDNSAIWNYKNNAWTNITKDESIEELNWEKYTVYTDDEKLGDYYLWHDEEKWYVFDKDRNSIDYHGQLFAYKSNYNIKPVSFNIKEIEDYTYIEQVLSTKNISVNKEDYSINDQIDIDFDNDGKKEVFYIASNSNMYNVYDNKDKTFSIVIMVKDNKIYPIYSEINEKTERTCIPYIRSFIDIDNDNRLESILSCDNFSAKSKKFLYTFTDKNKYQILISNR